MLKSAALSADTLANVLDQSVDCVKLLGLDGQIKWMNSNGLCAMEIDDFGSVCDKRWDALWPDSVSEEINRSLVAARSGETVRFDAYCPTAKGSARWWNVTVSGVNDIDGQFAGYLAVSRDISETELQRQAMLIAAEEMRHRLRNTYAMIGSLLNSFARGNETHLEFAKEMQSRLISLSNAQSLFSAPDVPCDIAVLIPALIEPFATPACTVSAEQIENVSVSQAQADAIALLVGELAVNSAKHGAMRDGGTVDLSARVEGGHLAIVWTECSINPVTAHHRSGGQGLKLIERIVELRQGSISTEWTLQGPVVSVRFAHGSPI